MPDKREKFCSACQENDFETVFKMIETDKCNPRQSLFRSYDQKPLHCAALHGNLSVMKKLVEQYRCKPECRDGNGCMPLHYACYYGHLDVAKYLVVERNCDPHMTCRTYYGRGRRRYRYRKDTTSLYYALKISSPSILAATTETVVSEKNYEVVEFLVTNYHSARQMREGTLSQALMEVVCQYGTLEYMKQLVEEKKVDPNQQSNKAVLVHTACKHGNLKILEYLIRDMKFKMMSDSYGNTALHHSCGASQLQVVRFLIESNLCEITAENLSGETPVHAACAAPQPSLAVIELVSENCDPNCKTKKGDTPLHMACKGGSVELVKYLKVRGSDPNIANNDHKLPLHHACEHSLEMVKLVVVPPPRPEVRTGYRHVSPLHIACSAGNLAIVQYLIEEMQYNPCIDDGRGLSPLHCACGYTESYSDGSDAMHVDVVEYLVSECDCNPMERYQWGVCSPYEFACTNGNVALVEALVGSDIDCLDDGGNTPLHIASENVQEGVVAFLVSEGCNQSIQNEKGELALHVACSINQYRADNEQLLNIVKLVSNCSNVDAVTQAGETALHIACSNGYTEIVQFLTEEKTCNQNIQNKEGELPLHIACSQHSLNMVRLVSDCNVHCKAASGRTPLHIEDEQIDIVRYLVLERQCVPTVCPEDYRDLLIHVTCKEGDLELVKAVATNDNINCTDDSGNSPLHIACAHTSPEMSHCQTGTRDGSETPKASILEVVNYLVNEKNCDVNVYNSKDETALHIASARPEFDVKPVSNSTPNARDMNGNTPLHIACKSGNIHAVRHLIEEKQCDASISNKNEELPVHYACKHSLEMVLLVGNCNVDSPNHLKQTPLHIACSHGLLELVTYLIEERHCNPNVEDGVGLSALHYACGFQGMCNQFESFYRFASEYQATPAEGSLQAYQYTKELRSKNIKVAKYLVSRHECDPLKNVPPLGLACKESNLELLKALTTILNVNNVDKSGNTSLHLACMNDRVELVTYLVKEQHCRQTVKNQNGELPLHIACKQGSLAMVKLVSTKSNIKVNVTTVTGDTLLHIACRHNTPEVVNYLIKENYDPNVLNKGKEMPLHIASARSLDLVKLVSECQLDYDAKTAKGDTALHIAWRNGHHGIVKYLVHVKGSDPTIPDTNQSIPICMACEKHDFEMVKALATHTSVNCKDQKGNTPLHIACIRVRDVQKDNVIYTKRKVYVTDYLREFEKILHFLTKEMGCNQSILNTEGKLALHIACAKPISNNNCDQQLGIVKLVSDCDDPNVQDEVGNTPLHIACQYSAHDVVEYLVRVKGSDVTLKNENDELPLHIASSKSLQMVELVYTTECNHKTMDGNTPLHIACEHGSSEIAMYLVKEIQCDQTIQNSKREIPLHIACRKMNLEVVKTVSNCTNPDLQDVNGDTPLHIACKGGRVEIIQCLLKLCINAAIQNHSGDTALHIACRNLMTLTRSNCKQKIVAPHIDILQSLLDILQSLLDILQSLLDKDQSSVNVPNEEGELPLHIVCQMGEHTVPLLAEGTRLEMVSKQLQLLAISKTVSNCTNPDLQDINGDTPLHIACKGGRVEIIQCLLKLCINAAIQNHSGDTALHIACRNLMTLTRSNCKRKIVAPHIDILQSLLDKDQSSANVPNEEGDLPLHIVCQMGKHTLQTVEIVSKHTTNPDLKTKSGNTPLHIACKHSTHDCHIVKHLVNERKCDTSLTNSNGELPLHIACSHGSLAMAKVVFSSSVNPHLPIKEAGQYSLLKSGDTPLHIACRSEQAKLVQFLIRKRCSPSIANSCGELPQHIACEKGSLKILKLVSCYQGDINRQTADGSTALHIACKECYKIGIMEFLIRNRCCDPSIQNNNGDTPLHILCRRNTYGGMTYYGEFEISLFETGQSVQNKDGELPLHIACRQMRSLDTVKMVSKCNVNVQTSEGKNTPLHEACLARRGYHSVDVIRYLVEEKQCDVNIPNSKGELPLHILCAKGTSVNIVKLVSDCDVNAQTYDCKDTPLHLACANVHHYPERESVVTHLIEEKHCDLNITNSKGELSLHIACRSRSLELVKFVSDCDVNSQMHDGNTPLHIACSDGNQYPSTSESIVRFLVKEKHCSLIVQNEQKELPLHIACRQKSLDVVKLVLEGIGINMRSLSGDTPLHEACKNHRYGTEIVTYLVEVNKCNTVIKNYDNELPLHLACQGRPLEMIKVLSKHNDAVACQNNDGKTPMHYLCEMNATKAIQYLLSSGKVSKQVLSLSDNTDQTPIMLATDPEITRVLIAYGADPTPLYKVHQKFFEQYSSEKPPPTPLNILVVGNASTGKTTLIESLKHEGNTSGYQQGAREHTAGIIPNKFKSEIYGLVIMYDFAGQREYYASHGGVFHSIIRHSPPVFLLLINVSEDERCIKQDILYWLSFIETQCSKSLRSSPHLIIVGSHADILIEEGRDPKAIISQVMRSLHSRLKRLSVTFVGSVTMDCRECQSFDIDDLRKHLQQSSNQLGEKVVMNFTCHHLYVHLLDKFREMPAVPYSQISAAFIQHQQVSSIHQFYRREHSPSNSDKLLPTSHTDMIRILEELNDRGHILFVKDPKHLQRSWVILNKETLLGKIHGSVFAPKDFKQHHTDLASSTGVVPFSKIAHHFPEYDPNMIAAFLSQMEFCLEINDREVLELMISSSVEKRVPLDPSDKYFFFPNLVNIDTPQTIHKSRHVGYQCGWLLHCTQQDQFFTPHFLQVLLLRLIFAFALVPGTPSIADHMPVVKRICSVWKSGIHWQNRDGVETVVEVIEHSQAVLVMMHCLECKTRLSVELNCIHLRSLIIQKVRDAKEEFCPRLFTTESFIHPNDLQYPPKPCKDITLFSIGSIAKSVVGSKPFIISDTGQDISTQQLLCFDSYYSMGEKVMESLFEECNIDKEVKDKFLNEMSEAITRSEEECMQLFKRIMMHQKSETMLQERINQAPAGRLHELMRIFLVWRDCSDTPTYSSLRRELDGFSIFCGRNPLVSISIDSRLRPLKSDTGAGLIRDTNIDEGHMIT